MSIYSLLILLVVFSYSQCLGQVIEEKNHQNGLLQYVQEVPMSDKPTPLIHKAKIEYFRKQISNDSTEYIYFYAIAQSYYCLKEYDSAKFYTHKALLFKKDFSSNYLLLAKNFQGEKILDSTVYYYNLATQYETDIAIQKKHKLFIINALINNKKYLEAYKNCKELLAIDSTDLNSNYYHVKLLNMLGEYQEAKNSIFNILKIYDFENIEEKQSSKYLTQLICSLFELKEMKLFDIYWNKTQNVISKNYPYEHRDVFLLYTYLAGYEDKLSEKIKIATTTEGRYSVFYILLQYFNKKHDCAKVKPYGKKLDIEDMDTILLERCLSKD